MEGFKINYYSKLNTYKYILSSHLTLNLVN